MADEERNIADVSWCGVVFCFAPSCSLAAPDSYTNFTKGENDTQVIKIRTTCSFQIWVLEENVHARLSNCKTLQRHVDNFLPFSKVKMSTRLAAHNRALDPPLVLAYPMRVCIQNSTLAT